MYELKNSSNILYVTFYMTQIMKTGHKWILAAQIGIKQPIFANNLLKFAFFDVKYALKIPKILFSEVKNSFKKV